MIGGRGASEGETGVRAAHEKKNTRRQELTFFAWTLFID
jgi:hypothetical protein